jgi:hypothetical protein
LTANRIITVHEELDDSGVVPHSTLDELANLSFVVTSGTFRNSRTLVQGPGVSIVDDGEKLIVSAQAFQMSWVETPIAGDNNTFTLQHPPNPSSALMFFINGVLQSQGTDNDYMLNDNVVTVNYDCGGNKVVATYPW